jgi:hypothetical protein
MVAITIDAQICHLSILPEEGMVIPTGDISPSDYLAFVINAPGVTACAAGQGSKIVHARGQSVGWSRKPQEGINRPNTFS